MIHKIERGDSSPTATLLARLSGAFGISMSTLIARAEMQEGKLLRLANQPVWRDPQTHYLRRHVSPRSDMPIDLVQVVHKFRNYGFKKSVIKKRTMDYSTVPFLLF